MYNSASSELLMSVDCSSSSSINALLQRRTKKTEVSLMSFASEEDDEVLFDSKQCISFHLTVVLISLTKVSVCHSFDSDLFV